MMSALDTNALFSTVIRFFQGLDARNHAAVAALMAKKGTWVRQGTPLVGSEAVLRALEQRDPLRATAHIVTNLWIEHATGDTARIRFYMTAFETHAGSDTPQMLGVRDCTDDLVLEDGEWRIWHKDSRRILPPG